MKIAVVLEGDVVVTLPRLPDAFLVLFGLIYALHVMSWQDFWIQSEKLSCFGWLQTLDLTCRTDLFVLASECNQRQCRALFILRLLLSHFKTAIAFVYALLVICIVVQVVAAVILGLSYVASYKTLAEDTGLNMYDVWCNVSLNLFSDFRSFLLVFYSIWFYILLFQIII